MNNEIRITPPHKIGDPCFVIYNGKVEKTSVADMNYSIKQGEWRITVDNRIYRSSKDYPYVISGTLIVFLSEKESVNLEEGKTVFFNEKDAINAAEHKEMVDKVINYIYDHQKELHRFFLGEDESEPICTFGGKDNFRKNTNCVAVAESMTVKELNDFLKAARAKVKSLKNIKCG